MNRVVIDAWIESDDVMTMLRAVQAHVQQTGEVVEAHDNPRQLRVGFVAPSKRWHVRLATLKKSAMNDTLRGLFCTTAGRTEIALSLSRGIIPGA